MEVLGGSIMMVGRQPSFPFIFLDVVIFKSSFEGQARGKSAQRRRGGLRGRKGVQRGNKGSTDFLEREEEPFSL